ncbi:non-specific serine/threonine protein kinase [Caenorhabditis elegans]|uniref:non-specific serine/threonine protein kinase n=1 Tax=Caenorhabditis elegans TaxID=6239 RepID=Q20192_CAEEL|nr:Protein kinase domain-containing protein [Caenorhabditis elegans]CCD66182.1 Protein kinase domain-containing protein [Caenorhabditis elegans]|eukprot:NP_510730.1 Uncharacterized protein CELE_F39F10.3 [Caenorhabditis elegans]
MNTIQQVDHYTLEKLLGKGMYGEVHLCKDDRNNEARVAKLILKEHNGIRDKSWAHETLALNAVAGVNGVPRMFATGSTDYHNWIVMDLLSDDLEVIICRNENKKFAKATGYQILWQVVKILKDIHSKGIVHGDIKPNNLMVSHSSNMFQLVLVDFGCARRFKDVNGNRTPPAPYPSNCIKGLHIPPHSALGMPHMEAEDIMQVAYLSCLLRQYAPWKDDDEFKMTRKKMSLALNPEKFLEEHQDLLPVIKLLAAQKHYAEPDYIAILDLLQQMLHSSGGGLANGSLNATVVARAIHLP